MSNPWTSMKDCPEHCMHGKAISDCQSWRKDHMKEAHSKIDETLEAIKQSNFKILASSMIIQTVIGLSVVYITFGHKMGWL